MIDPADAFDLAEDQYATEQVARAICRAYCRLDKRPEWDLLTKAEQDREIDYQWDMWVHEAIAAISAHNAVRRTPQENDGAPSND